MTRKSQKKAAHTQHTHTHTFAHTHTHTHTHTHSHRRKHRARERDRNKQRESEKETKRRREREVSHILFIYDCKYCFFREALKKKNFDRDSYSCAQKKIKKKKRGKPSGRSTANPYLVAGNDKISLNVTCQHTWAFTSAYVAQSAYVSIRQHTYTYTANPVSFWR